MKLKFTSIGDEIHVYNKKNDFLGIICYYKKWKCWIWDQHQDIIMSEDCLQQVCNKLKVLDKAIR